MDSIRKFHPLDKILIIDTGSPDTDYLSCIKNYDVEIRSSGPNYEFGAWKEAFTNYDESEYICIQDSVTLLRNFQFKNKDSLNSYYVFPYSFQSLGSDDARRYLSEVFTAFKMHPKTDIGMTGSMLMINNHVKEILLRTNIFDKFIPKNKLDSEISERLISCVFENLGYNVFDSGVNGVPSGDGIFFNKFWAGRL